MYGSILLNTIYLVAMEDRSINPEATSTTCENLPIILFYETPRYLKDNADISDGYQYFRMKLRSLQTRTNNRIACGHQGNGTLLVRSVLYINYYAYFIKSNIIFLVLDSTVRSRCLLISSSSISHVSRHHLKTHLGVLLNAPEVDQVRMPLQCKELLCVFVTVVNVVSYASLKHKLSLASSSQIIRTILLPSPFLPSGTLRLFYDETCISLFRGNVLSRIYCPTN